MLCSLCCLLAGKQDSAMGSKTDESDNSSCSAPTTLQKAGRSSSGRGRLCQAKGCSVDLDRLGKAYHSKKRLCEDHMRSESIEKRNGEGLWRFCQQCGKLEPLAAFDSNKRSCRNGLQRRREQSAVQSTQKKQQQQNNQMFTEYMWLSQQQQGSGGSGSGSGTDLMGSSGIPTSRAVSAPAVPQKAATSASGIPPAKRPHAAALMAKLRDLTAEYAALKQSLDGLA
ncbi:hypothetical protein OEZ85_000347 [Tetradesmus obliquus]|uniref:SBP-type domain-containing protein n=1 Tax=Tetradesmus obliquus TaxID=3088 RepID=A0ABY8UTI9_TETOB|nr:hypothetical protein OEZ85_000347 [Tetradesmus obliquus]